MERMTHVSRADFLPRISLLLTPIRAGHVRRLCDQNIPVSGRLANQWRMEFEACVQFADLQLLQDGLSLG